VDRSWAGGGREARSRARGTEPRRRVGRVGAHEQTRLARSIGWTIKSR
jgi:hypothetical protein